MTTKAKIIIAIIGCAICLCIGFLFGRSMSEVVTKVEYVREPAISGLITNLTPVKEIRPTNPALPMKRDTIYINNTIYITEKVDSAAIIADYELKRTYEMSFFDNHLGKLDVSYNVQYNKSDSVRWEFIPIRTVQTVITERVWRPFASISYSTTGYIGAGGGLYYKKIGVEYQRQFSTIPEREDGNQFSVKYQF